MSTMYKSPDAIRTKSISRKYKSSSRFSKYASYRHLVAFVIMFGAIGGLMLWRSFAVTLPLAGGYAGSPGNPASIPYNKIDAFAQTYLGKPSADRALDFVAKDNWSTIEGAGWQLDPWAGSGYKQKMIFSIPLLPNNDSTATLATGANGSYNAHFTKLAQNLVNRGMGNATLRPGWEFNGGWYTWKAKGNEQNFINYWRNIVNSMRAVPNSSFKFDWNPTNGYGDFPAENAYPGDAYVDFIGVDVYNQSWAANYQNHDVRWNEIYSGNHGLAFWISFAKTHNKPLSFPEWGTGTREDGHGGGDDPLFITKMYNVMVANNVGYHVYWEYCASDYCAAFSQNPKAAAEFKKLFSGVATAPAPAPAPTPTPAPAPAPTPSARVSQTGNLVSGKTFFSSVGAVDGTRTINKINDTVEAEANRYVSTPGASNVAMTVDLGANYNLSKISILWAQDTTRNFELQLSMDNASWKTVHTGATDCSSPPPKLSDYASLVNNPVGRYFRVLAKDLCNASYGHSIWEVGVYGSAATVAPVTNAPAPTTPPISAPIPDPAPTPNSSQPLDITPVGSNTPTSIPANSIVTITGPIKLSNPSISQSDIKKVEIIVDSKKITQSSVAPFAPTLDTTTLSNGNHTVEVRTTKQDGTINSTDRNIMVNNNLNAYEELRNYAFKSLGGKSGRTLNLMLGGISSILTVTLSSIGYVYIAKPRWFGLG